MTELTAQGVVTPEQHDATVAAVVRALLGGVPWSRARKLCSAGRVWKGDEALTDPATRVQAGDEIHVVGAGQAARAKRREITLLHVDPDVVVVDKPAGVLTVPYQGDERDTLMHLTHSALRRLEGKRHLPPLRVVQRLDKDTTGALVFARNRKAERGLGEQFRRHSVERLYLGLAYDRVMAGSHDTWLVPDRGDGRRGSWHPSRGRQRPPSARRAVTHVLVRERLEGPDLQWDGSNQPGAITLVSCRLETGRQHQIRIHLAEAGHPLVGEKVYDRQYLGPRLHAFCEGRGRPMLHAADLGFMHPTRDRSVRFTSDLPTDFADLLSQLAVETGR
ncbi:MAG: RluA family pseudouridine synthase [Deltaproteobacteria bacterium]|nr:RluA family pseudouridine synthase [Deltaproteobacteria bacterium]